MNRNLPYKILLFCFGGGLFLIFGLYSSYLINEDSYEFLIPSFLSSTSRLGEAGDLFSGAFYNRSGYSVFIKCINFISDNFTGTDLHQILIFINYIALILTSILIFLIVEKLTKHKFISITASLFYMTSASVIFSASTVASDTLSICILLFITYNFLQKGKLSILTLCLFGILSIFRIEYLFLILPMSLMGNDRKNFKYALLFALLCNSILFAPQFTQTWLAHQLTLFSILKFELLYYVSLAVFLFIIFKNYSSIALKALLLTTMGAFLMVLYEPSNVKFISTTIYGMLFLLVLPISLHGAMYFDRKSYKDDTEVKYYIAFFIQLVFILFLVYRTFYFQHLVVLVPYVAIITGLLLHKFVRRYLDNIQFTKQISLLSFILIIGMTLNLVSYLHAFSGYTVDLAQLYSLEINQYLSENRIEKNRSIVFTEFPKATFYWTRVSSIDINNVNRFADIRNNPDITNILIATIGYDYDENKLNQINGFKVRDVRKLDLKLNYDSDEIVVKDYSYLKIYLMMRQSRGG